MVRLSTHTGEDAAGSLEACALWAFIGSTMTDDKANSPEREIVSNFLALCRSEHGTDRSVGQHLRKERGAKIH